jgi:hypothetical protein
VRLHERYNVVPKAANDIERAVVAVMEDADVTDAEYGLALVQAFDRLLSVQFRAAIRMERHGDPDKPGDEA